MKSATVDWAIPAIPESMCFSPHAMSQNGSAFATTPITTQRRHEARAPGQRGCPILAARRPNSTTAAIEALAHQRRGLEAALDRHLDEEVRGAPYREGQEEGPVPAHPATLSTPESRARREGSAQGQRQSHGADVVTSSSRKIAP